MSEFAIPSQRASRGRSILLRGVAAVGAGAAVLGLVDLLLSVRIPRLHSNLGGSYGRYPARHGDIAWAVQGTGPPVLLVHGLSHGDSMQEWEQLFNLLSRTNTVYAFDFLGYGLSDHPDELRPEDFAEQITHFAIDLVEQPCTLVASREACMAAISACFERPGSFHRLVLLGPTSSRLGTGMPGRILALFERLPVLHRLAYKLFLSQRTMSGSAQHYFVSRADAHAFVRARYLAAHQPDSNLAGFVASQTLGLVDHRYLWTQLNVPALILWGRQAEELTQAPEWLARQPLAMLEIINGSAVMPHLDHPEEVADSLGHWLSSSIAHTLQR